MSRIIVLQDNFKPHINSDDSKIIGAGKVGGWNIQLEKQLANSPDLNILDLEFFNAIQSLQDESSPKNIEELICTVESAYAAFDPMKLNNIFYHYNQL